MIMTRSATCCGCLTVRFGTRLLGWLGSIGTISGALLYFYCLTHEEHVREFLHARMATYTTEEAKQETLDYLDNMIPILWFGLVVTTLMFISNILLLVGVSFDKRMLMLPWICLNFVVLICEVVYTIAEPIYSGRGMAVIMTNLVISILGGLISFYCLKCGYNHYMDLKEGVGDDEPVQSRGPPQKFESSQSMLYQGASGTGGPPQYHQAPIQYQQGSPQYKQGAPPHQCPKAGAQYQQGAPHCQPQFQYQEKC